MPKVVTAAVLAFCALGSSAALAQTPDPPCGPIAVAPPAELAQWQDRTGVYAAANPAEKAPIAPQRGFDAKLRINSAVRFAMAPEKPPTEGSFGGMFELSIEQAGTYRIAIGSGAWIDVIQDGKAISSTHHGHGPDCTGIRKMVDFPLRPGQYVLQLSGNETPILPLLVAKLP